MTSSIYLEPEDAGKVLFQTRAKPSPLAWTVLIAIITAAGVTGYFIPQGGIPGAVACMVGALLMPGSLYLIGWLELHRVCENALVLGISPWPGNTPYVIPWSTVVPETLTVHTGRGTRHHAGTAPGEPADRGTRQAVYTTRAVSIGGLYADLAHPKRRHSLSAQRLVNNRTERQLEQNPPLTRWVMGVRDPEPLARAIETALIARGLGRPGLADHALANPVRGAAPGELPQTPPC